MTTMQLQRLWDDLARQLRADSIRCTTAAGSGHPTSAMSAADLMAVLLASHLRYDFAAPAHPNNDRLVLSKGHASPLLYALFKAAAAITDQELLSLRRFGSRIQGHPTRDLPWVDVATGSLGQGLPVAVGIALAAKRLDRMPFRTWVLLGDSELAEGSVYEALAMAAHYQLDNLIAVVDVNRLGQRGPTTLQWDLERYRARFEAFGWQGLVIDGHDAIAIDQAYRQAVGAGRPACILARTRKGRGVSFTEDADGWHGRALNEEQAARALAEIAPPSTPLVIAVARPEDLRPPPVAAATAPQLPRWTIGEKVATRHAFGEALRALGAALPDLVVLDAEVADSTGSERFAREHPERFFELYIAEQLLVSVGQGMATRGRRVFAATFAAFLTRAHDQIRMAAISATDLRLCGSHAGVAVGEDGASQMALEDLAMMRAVSGSTVLYPCDAVSTAHLVAAMAERPGISYLRTTRGATPVLYGPDERFPIGGSKVLRSSPDDRATLIAAGITVHQALAAASRLAGRGLAVRVIDCYSIKPLDAAVLRRAADETGHVVVAEDHRVEGGLGEAVLAALAATGPVPSLIHRAVRTMPQSGRPEQLLAQHGLDADGLEEAVHLALAAPVVC